jgi:2-methylcitrate dehydratase PrpD
LKTDHIVELMLTKRPVPGRVAAREEAVTIAQRLAEFVCDTSRAPKDAERAAVKAILDLMAAAIVGYGTAGPSSIRQAVRSAWGAGPAPIWFSGDYASVTGAAFVNSASASALDLDDGHRLAAGHPGAAIIPAVLATAESVPCTAERVLTAIALGYEIGVRISAARDMRMIATTDSGQWCGQAVCAAVGWLRNLPPSPLANAIAIAGTTSPSQSATPYTRMMGNHVKEGIPWATANGLLAIELAQSGLTGPIDLLDAHGGFDQATLVAGLGSSWHLETIYFKPYSCCRWIHAPIDALLALAAEHRFSATDIETIEVDTFGRALTLNNEIAPTSLEGAQYSIPFCLAVAALRGARALLPLEDSILADREAIALAGRVHVAVDPLFDRMFPAAAPGRVRVRTASSCFEREILSPRGDPTNPMGEAEIETKFRQVATGRMQPGGADRVADAIASLGLGDLEALRNVLQSPLLLASETSLKQPVAVSFG